MTRAGIYEAWKIPGGKERQERVTANVIKPIDGYIIIAGPARRFRIHWLDGIGFYGWKLLENQPVGRDRGAVDNWVPLDEFSSLREARAEARRLARP